MEKIYRVLNVHDLIDEKTPFYIGEGKLIDILTKYSCKQNKEVEDFLHYNATEFTKKSQSITYLVFEDDSKLFVGYFTLAIKPITVFAEKLSKNARKKVERISLFDEESQSYTMAAYLIAQLGKNYSVNESMQIPGEKLLASAYEIIQIGKRSFGGTVAFLECENVPFLLNFYQKNGHIPFSERKINSKNLYEPCYLQQLLKFI